MSTHSMGEYKEWAKFFFKSKDMLAREIISIDDSDTDLLTIHKKRHGQEFIEKIKIIGDADFKICSYTEKTWYIVSNTKKNVESVVNYWGSLRTMTNTTILFINLSTGNKWALHPSTHAKINEDPKSIFALHKASEE